MKKFFFLIFTSIILFCTNAGIAEEFKTIRQGLAGKPGNYWQNKTIPVCFRATSTYSSAQVQTIRDRTETAVSDSWQENSPLIFTGFGTCSDEPSGIRIKLFEGRSNAGQGSGANKRVNINLDINAPAQTIIHEFGHALNFGHSQAREDTPGHCISELGGSSKSTVADNLTEWDPYSIMNYCRLSSLKAELSPLDIVGLIRAYGHNKKNNLGLNEKGDLFGQTLAVGDINNDGWPDIAVGAPGEAIGKGNAAKSAAGAVYIYTGRRGGALRPFDAVNQRGLGSNEAGDRFGSQVVFGNFDGVPGDELAVAAPFEKPGSATRTHGAIFIYRIQGNRMQPIDLITPQVIDQSYELLGHSRMAAGDLDGDGRDELYTSVKLGLSHHVLAFEKAATNLDMELVARQQYGVGSVEFGPGPLLIADVLSRPGPELVVGFPQARTATQPQAGEVQVITLVNGSFQRLDRVDGGINGKRESADRFGDQLAAGDFDGDGSIDIAIASPGEDINGSGPFAGMVSIFKGGASKLSFVRHISQATVGAGKPERNDGWGRALAAGDFNGDGLDDLAITVAGERADSRTERPGYIYIALGGTTGPEAGFYVSQPPEGANENDDRLGASLLGVDLDGDKVAELIAGAPGEAPGNQPKSGHLFVFRTPYAPLRSWYSFNQQF